MAKNDDYFKISAKLKKIVNFAEILKKSSFFATYGKILVPKLLYFPRS